MIEIESVRIILLLSMLGITSYFDVKTRMVPDVIWLIFGGIGTILYVFDYQNMTSYHVIALIMGGFVSFMIWRWNVGWNC
ncbi:MAG: prepilin peptidase [Nitrosopumilus sp.]